MDSWSLLGNSAENKFIDYWNKVKSNKKIFRAEASFPIVGWSFWSKISTGKNTFLFRHYFQILLRKPQWYFKSEFNPQERMTFKISPESLHLGFSLLNMPPKSYLPKREREKKRFTWLPSFLSKKGTRIHNFENPRG